LIEGGLPVIGPRPNISLGSIEGPGVNPAPGGQCVGDVGHIELSAIPAPRSQTVSDPGGILPTGRIFHQHVIRGRVAPRVRRVYDSVRRVDELNQAARPDKFPPERSGIIRVIYGAVASKPF